MHVHCMYVYVYDTLFPHRVASSEKVDKWARYCDFQIASMPFPGLSTLATTHCVNMTQTYIFFKNSGCEFFREYRDKKYNPVNLHFDWTQVTR